MGKKELYISIPSLFKCPISLEVMTSPVSLSTGVTYDRTSIQRWLDSGHDTCPATMQVLVSKDLIPNHNLKRLIHVWDRSIKPLISSEQILKLIDQVVSGSCPYGSMLDSFVKILGFTCECPENGTLISGHEGFVKKLTEILRLDGQDLLYLDLDLLDTVLKLLQIIVTSVGDTKQMYNWLIPILSKILNNTDRVDSRVVVIQIIESTATDLESKKVVFDNQDFLPRFLEILSRREFTDNRRETHAVLSCLISLCSPRRNKIKFIKSGGIEIITDLITKPEHGDNNDIDNNVIIELVLTLLEMLVGCSEGRVAITEDANCVPVIVSKLMKVSMAASEHAIAILWSLCYLFRDQKAREAMTRKSNGGLTKILLLMQSDCSPAVKRMCCDLIRVFRVCSKSCLSSYDAKTTHIMPC